MRKWKQLQKMQMLRLRIDPQQTKLILLQLTKLLMLPGWSVCPGGYCRLTLGRSRKKSEDLVCLLKEREHCPVETVSASPRR